jgi:hypothetical protein
LRIDQRFAAHLLGDDTTVGDQLIGLAPANGVTLTKYIDLDCHRAIVCGYIPL